MESRRKFITDLSKAGLIGVAPKFFINRPPKPTDNKIWGCHLYLTSNQWNINFPELRVNQKTWDDSLKTMAEEGMNMVVITMGNAVKYQTHPEIAVRNAWSVARLRSELDKIRQLGIEPIPLLNFSAAHDIWLQSYERMLSTEKYYAVCSDLIKEICEIFDNPRFFHLGMDEETYANQKDYDYVVVRQKELWWGDFYFLIGEVEKNGARPWIWSDYMWHYPDLFFKNMPKSVLQSNWFYKAEFDKKSTPVKSYLDLEARGFQQVPTGSNWGWDNWQGKDGRENMMNTVKFGAENISSSNLLGFLQTSWKETIEENRDAIMNSIHLAGEAKRWFESHRK